MDRTTSIRKTSSPPLQMAYAEINKDRFNHWMYNESIKDVDLGLQRLMASVFGSLEANEQGLRPFRVQMGRKNGVFYGYTTADAATLKRCVHVCADPMLSSIMPADTILCKTMPSDWAEGDQLGFEIRIRPTMRNVDQPTHAGAKRTPEMDAYRWATQDHNPAKGPKPLRSHVYGLMLRSMLQNQGGALPNLTRMAFYEQALSYRKIKGQGFRLPVCVLQGNLTVTDPEKFHELLRHGIGRGRGYGFGMLLLRPVISH